MYMLPYHVCLIRYSLLLYDVACLTYLSAKSDSKLKFGVHDCLSGNLQRPCSDGLYRCKRHNQSRLSGPVGGIHLQAKVDTFQGTSRSTADVMRKISYWDIQ